jgi:demethylmenaquinone methyltransferase/2-methoxy-6-polyprenyl-1,4-benzoquinol methylase
VCCGTADLALGFARGGAQVVGLDFSPEMLQVAINRIAKGRCPTAQNGAGPRPQKDRPQSNESDFQHGSLAFVRGDAINLPFPDNTFDIVSVGYGLRNLTDWAAGLQEMQRVAKPGGRLLALDLGKPDNPVWRFVYFNYLRLFVPCLGLVFCGSASAYSYLLESLKHYPAQHGVAAKMRDLGLREVKIITLLGAAMSINYAEK